MKTSQNNFSLLQDLDELYDLAIGKENITAALKIKEMQLKLSEKPTFDIDSLSNDQLDHLICMIEEKIKSENVQK